MDQVLMAILTIVMDSTTSIPTLMKL